ncbi:MAG: DUF1192 family protein [Emcibacteraceae bacterium]|jgi:uncharacterized small protein (DUF1192 family)|nr:DUF1192 family protein [Emcibacteraceae bacterium]
MKDDELNILESSIYEKLIHEDLTVHSLEALNNRVKVLKSEINRTALAISEKQNALTSANSIFS